MTRLRRLTGLRQWLLALYALAALLVPFAHRPLSLAEPELAELAAYALPGDILPELCLSVPDDGRGGGRQASAGICDACLLTAAPGLPACDLVVEAHAPARTRQALVTTPLATSRPRRLLVAEPRAPPSRSV